MPLHANADDLPILIEAKSAGDYTNTNKRRKEEATKIAQLTSSYGARIRFVLFLCGYFDSDYLGYEAAEVLTGLGSIASKIWPSLDYEVWPFQ